MIILFSLVPYFTWKEEAYSISIPIHVYLFPLTLNQLMDFNGT